MIPGAGALRDEITVKDMGAVGTDGNAAASHVRTQWGKIQPVSGREAEIGAATGQMVEVRITFRDAPLILKDHELHDTAGNVYEIANIRHFPGERQEVYCTLRNRENA